MNVTFESALKPDLIIALKDYAEYCDEVHLNVHPMQARDINNHTHTLLSQVDTWMDIAPPAGSGRTRWEHWYMDFYHRYSADAARVYIAGYVLTRAYRALLAD